jgi:hypothetical protein
MITNYQKFIILFGWGGVTTNLLGFMLGSLQVHLLALLLQRLSGAMYNAELGKFPKLLAYVPFIFGVGSVMFNSLDLAFLELASQSAIYQITAWEVFKLKNTTESK